MSRDQRREVEDMGRRYGVPLEHARKVGSISNHLFTELQPLHQLPPACGKLLEAAAHLIDVGHYISSSSHHKHSHYVVANSDMPGFTERERIVIAHLCRYHRKSMPTPMHSAYQNLPPDEKRTLLLMIPLLRLADNLDQSHEQRIERLACRWTDTEVTLQVHSRGDIDLEQWALSGPARFSASVQPPGILMKARD